MQQTIQKANHLVMAGAVRARTARQRVVDRLRDDSGEIGSWVLLAAFLAIAAAAAGAAISGWIGNETTNITNNTAN